VFFALGPEIPSHKETAEIAGTVFIIDHKSRDGAHDDKEPEEIILEEAQASDVCADMIEDVFALDDFFP
jgi:hypothetical protein